MGQDVYEIELMINRQDIKTPAALRTRCLYQYHISCKSGYVVVVVDISYLSLSIRINIFFLPKL